MHPAEKQVLRHICARLGISIAQFDQLEEMLKAGFGGGGYRGPQSQQIPIEDAYAMLGVNKSVSDTELKKSYRRLMSQHHPDKLVAKGLPDEMIKDATEKTQQIKSAYERIRESRGL
jgi:DnaJ like chaperone protein